MMFASIATTDDVATALADVDVILAADSCNPTDIQILYSLANRLISLRYWAETPSKVS